MFSASLTLSRRCALILVVLALCAVLAPGSAEAASGTDGQLAASSLAMPIGWGGDVMGNRTRMIQISCVVGAIGIFLLTRSYR